MTLQDLVKKSLTPLVYINFAGMALSGLSLLSLGFFQAVWPGVIGLLMSPIVFPLLLVPAAFFSGLMAMFSKSHPLLEKTMMFFSVAYLISVLTAYVMMCYHMLAGWNVNANLFHWPTVVPVMIYGTSSGVLPWLILAIKDRDNVFFTGLVFMAEVTSVVVMSLAVWQEWRFWTSVIVFWCVMGLLMILQAAYEKYILPRQIKA